MLFDEQQLGSPLPESKAVTPGSPKNRRSTRRQLNVPLLIGSLAAIALLLLVTKFWHDHKKIQLADAFLQRAEKLESEGNWKQATTYLQHYLWIKPDDIEVRLQLIKVTEKGVKTPKNRGRLSSMLYEMLGLVPERNDLRLKLAENRLALRDYISAEREARTVKDSAKDGSSQQAQAKRLIALSLYPRARESAGSEDVNSTTTRSNTIKNDSENALWAQRAEEVTIGAAAGALADSHQDFPGDLVLATITAEFYRKHQNSLNSEELDPAMFADQVMRRLLEESSEDPDALVSVYLYRSRYKLPEAKSLLDQAIQLAPNHHQTLLYIAAESARQAESPQAALDSARGSLQKAIHVQPKDHQAYVALARLHARAGDLDSSIETLQEGKQQVGAGNFLLGQELTSMLFEAKDLSEAEVALEELDKASQSKFLQRTAASRREAENLIRIMRSKLAIQKGDLQGAFRELKAVAAASGESSRSTNSFSRSSSGFEARRLLGILTEKLNQWDLAASYWSSLTVDAPQFGEAHRRAGLAYLHIRQPGKAVYHLDRYLKPTPPAAWTPQVETWLALLQSHLRLQLQNPSDRRNWAEFVQTLEQVRERLPERWEPLFVEADYLHAQATPEARAKAIQLFNAAEEQHPSDVTFWRSLVRGYSFLDSPKDAERALNQYEHLESDPIKRAQLRAAWLSQNQQYGKAEAVLLGLLPTSSPNSNYALQTQRLKIFLAAKQTGKAKELLNELILASPENPQLLTVGIEVLLSMGDLPNAEIWERKLQSLDLPDDFACLHFRARRYLRNYESLSKAENTELGELIATLRSARPSWHPIVALVGHYAELRGEELQAIDNYELAIKLGANNTEILKRLVLLLNNEERFADAEFYLNILSARQGNTLQVESLEITSALRNKQVPEALKIAREAADRHPEDLQRRIWLASLLSLDKQTEKESEEVYRKALLKAPKDIRLQNGLFNLLVKTQQLEEASTVLVALVQPLRKKPAKQHFALAHGYLQLGDHKRAATECELALESDPNLVACRLLHAKLLMATDAPYAEKQLQEILELDANNGEAKRLLASIWASSGRPTDTSRAMKLLETLESGSTLEHQANNRLRAQLLSRQGSSREERQENMIAARRIMQEQLERSTPPADVDRLLLARIYESEALLQGDLSTLQASREQWKLLIDRPEFVVQYQLQYLDFLFRQLSHPPQELLQQKEWENLREVFLAEVEVRIAELENLQNEKSSSLSSLKLLGYRVRLEKVQGDIAAAKQLLEEYSEQSLPSLEEAIGKARSYLAMGNFYASLGEHKGAARWYRELRELAPQTYVLLVRELAAQGQLDEAIDICIASQEKAEDSSANVAAVLAQLLSTAEEKTLAKQRVQPIIDAALNSHEDNIDLLLAVAVLKVTQGDDDAAIQIFQQVLNLEPEHPLALNNLATLLSERSNQLSEALDYIGQAIQISGRQPALLDTLGTIQFRMGEFQQAIDSLEEAVSLGSVDARYQFHLAVAYQKAGQTGKSREALLRAQQSGLKKMILTQGDQQLLKDLEQKINSNKS